MLLMLMFDEVHVHAAHSSRSKIKMHNPGIRCIIFELLGPRRDSNQTLAICRPSFGPHVCHPGGPLQAPVYAYF
jgi:hypothetical protein